VRAHAERLGLAVADKPDSQDICFVPEGGYASVVEKLRPGALEAGDIVHVDGAVLGRHDGIINFTVGQRRGLGIGGGDPLYVVAVDPTAHRVIVGPPEALLGDRVAIRDINWLGEADALDGGARVSVKLRSQSTPVAATLNMTSGDAGLVTLDAAQAGIAPGQACVAYLGERVMGGGWIARADQLVASAA